MSIKKERILEIIDIKILELLSNGLSINDIKKELDTKCSQRLSRIDEDILDELVLLPFEQINPVTYRYAITYVRHAMKRMTDLDWLEENKAKLSKYSNNNYSRMFKMLIFKDLLLENKIKLPF